MRKFQTAIRAWYRANGRHTLPWRRTRNPYRILASEIMLQQTQVPRVIQKYREFLRAFPSLRALDRAPLTRVIRVWSGLGYNRRAVYLKRIARTLLEEFGGTIPRDPMLLRQLPGVGGATAGAIGAFAFGRRTVFIETNIRRVYIQFFFPGRRRVHDDEILKKIGATLPRRNIREWYYALMDYGASAFRNQENPNRRSAHYARQPAFRGSRRELRGRIVAAVARDRRLTVPELRRRMGRDSFPKRFVSGQEFRRIIGNLQSEGLLTTADRRIRIAP